jgi:hypothetical protein
MREQGGEYSDLEDETEVEQSAAASKDVADSSAQVLQHTELTHDISV